MLVFTERFYSKYPESFVIIRRVQICQTINNSYKIIVCYGNINTIKFLFIKKAKSFYILHLFIFVAALLAVLHREF